MNVQFAIKDGEVYMLEVNPRASRTVPFVAKVIGKPIAGIAAAVMAGEPLAAFGLKPPKLKHVAVKEAVFPFARFPGVDTDPRPGDALHRRGDGHRPRLRHGVRQEPARRRHRCCRMEGTVFVSVRDADKDRIVGAVRELEAMGFRIIATRGTKRHLEAHGIACELVNKVLEGRPHIVDVMKNGEVHLVFNTTEGAKALADSKDIRRTALLHHIPYYTTLAGAVAVTQAIKALKAGTLTGGAVAKLREPPILIHRDSPAVRAGGPFTRCEQRVSVVLAAVPGRWEM